MEIKKKIGKRIASTRKKLGLSKVALSEKTGFGASRLGNWEAGIRTPKLVDVKVLEEVLGVASTYILCLVDNEDGSVEKNYKSMPLFNEETLTQLNNETPIENIETLPLPVFLEPLLADKPLALRVFDNSMSPLYSKGNILVFLQNKEAKHNDIVLASLPGLSSPIIRKYFIDTSNIENISTRLIPLNDEWVTNHVTDTSSLTIHGVLSNHETVIF
jgi:transcriptional regulator with XRE-family HTH domain